VFSKITTERLAIRGLEARDAQRIFEYRSRPEVSRFQSWGTRSPEEIQAYIRELSTTEPGTPGVWYQVGIMFPAGNELIGDCGFCVLETEPRQAEVGIALATEFQGRGYAAEALRALLDYLFTRLGKHRVFGSVDPRNLSSLRLMQRIGMRQEGHFVQSVWFKGEWVDDVIFAMLAREWNRKRQSMDSEEHPLED
jgi:RimJ/RimL family protein N-acetyltransferase